MHFLYLFIFIFSSIAFITFSFAWEGLCVRKALGWECSSLSIKDLQKFSISVNPFYIVSKTVLQCKYCSVGKVNSKFTIVYKFLSFYMYIIYSTLFRRITSFLMTFQRMMLLKFLFTCSTRNIQTIITAMYNRNIK